MISGYWEEIHWLQASAIALVGGFLGILFAIPIRRALILQDPMDYPEGTATADVISIMLPPEFTVGSLEYIRQRRRNRKSLLLLALGAVFGCIIKLGSSTLFLWDGIASTAVWLTPTVSLYFGMTLSPALSSVGYIVGWRSATNIVIGSVLCWWFFMPLVMMYENVTYPPDYSPVTAAFDTWAQFTRFIGIGGMLLGGTAIILFLSKPMMFAIIRGFQTYWKHRKQGFGAIPLREQDMPPWIVAPILVSLLAPLIWLCYDISNMWSVTMLSCVFVFTCGFLFACVGAYMAAFGCVVGSLGFFRCDVTNMEWVQCVAESHFGRDVVDDDHFVGGVVGSVGLRESYGTPCDHHDCMCRVLCGQCECGKHA